MVHIRLSHTCQSNEGSIFMKQFFIFLILLFVLCLASCNEFQDGTNTEMPEIHTSTNSESQDEQTQAPYNTNCKLVVKGKEISTPYIHMDHEKHCVEIPWGTVICALGGSAEWQNENVLVLKYADWVMSIDASEVDFGFPPMPGGTNYVRKVVDGEIIMDSDQVGYTLRYHGISLDIDYEHSVIFVDDLLEDNSVNE